MKKSIFVLIIAVAVVSGLIYTNREIKNEAKPLQKPLSEAQRKANLKERKKWEASPDGIMYKKWENSPEGKKIHASHDKIRKHIKDFTNMEAVVTSVTFQRENGNATGPKWLIVNINGETYMMQYTPNDFKSFKNLKVNDKIIVKSRSAGYSHNHPYLILSGDYIAKNNQVLFKRDFKKNNRC